MSRCTSREAGFWRGPPGPPSLPRPRRGAPRGALGVGARRGGAGPRPGMSSAPPGVARRLHQTPLRAPARAAKPPGAFRANLPTRAGPGLLGPGRRLRERRARPRPPPHDPSERARGLLTCASGRPARPLDGLHSERPPRGAARPDPGLAARESARRSDGYETGSLHPFRHRGHRLSPPLRVRAPPPPPPAAASTNRSAGSRATRPPPRDGRRHQPIRGSAAARGGGARGAAPAGVVGVAAPAVAGGALRGFPLRLLELAGGGPELWE